MGMPARDRGPRKAVSRRVLRLGPDSCLSTGEFAQAAGVFRDLVITWLNSQELIGYRLPSGLREWRIEYENGRKFLVDHGMSTRGIEEWARSRGLLPRKPPRILVMSADRPLIDAFRKLTTLVSGAPSVGLATVMLCDGVRLDAVVADALLGRQEAAEILDIARLHQPQALRLCLATDDVGGECGADTWPRSEIGGAMGWIAERLRL